MKKGIGDFFIIVGIFCILSAGALAVYNSAESRKASRALPEMLEELALHRENIKSDIIDNESQISEAESTDKTQSTKPETSREPENIYKTENKKEKNDFEPKKSEDIYSGEIIIPDLNLRLPVLSSFSYENLRLAPCKYSCNEESGNLVIAAHNYPSHFGKLSNLAKGAELYFCDMENNTIAFEMAEMEILLPEQTKELTFSEYPMTLFTCNYSGRQRIVLRFIFKSR